MVVAALATWRYGTGWLEAFGPLGEESPRRGALQPPLPALVARHPPRRRRSALRRPLRACLPLASAGGVARARPARALRRASCSLRRPGSSPGTPSGRCRSPPWRRTGLPGSSRSASARICSRTRCPCSLSPVSTATKLISVAEAQRLVLERAQRLDAERVPVERAAGRVLAEPAASLVDLPPFPELRDGRLRGPGRGRRRGRPPPGRRAGSPPGRRPSGRSRPAEAMAISTGGAVPEGADAVIPLELVEDRASAIEIREAVAAGANVRERGSDVRTGDVVLEPGMRLGPGAGRRARGRRDPRGAVREAPARRDPRHGIRAEAAGRRSSARERSTSRTGFCSRPRCSWPARFPLSSGSSGTTRTSSSVRWSARCSASTCS